jgi:hypothetical protein
MHRRAGGEGWKYYQDYQGSGIPDLEIQTSKIKK